MYQHSDLSPVLPIVPALAIGAAQKLDLVCAKLAQQVDTVNGKVQKRGTIFVQPSADLLGSPETDKTAFGADYPMFEPSAKGEATYALEEHKRGGFVPESDERYSQVPGSLVSEQIEAIGRFLALKLEARVASLFFSTANWPDAALVDIGGGGVQWSTNSTAKPDTDLDALYILAREQAYNSDPDTLIIGVQALDQYRRCLQAQGVAVVTSGAARGDILSFNAAVDRIQANLGVRVIVGRSRAATSAPGLSHTSGYIWGKGMWMGCLGGKATPSQTGMVLTDKAALVMADTMGSPLNLGGMTLPISVRTHYQPPTRVDGRITAGGTVIAAECITDEVVGDANLGYYVTAVAA